jgi:hypothetical protein
LGGQYLPRVIERQKTAEANVHGPHKANRLLSGLRGLFR